MYWRRSSRKGLDRWDDGNEMLSGWSLHETRSEGWYGMNVARAITTERSVDSVGRCVFEAERKNSFYNVVYICVASDCVVPISHTLGPKKEAEIYRRFEGEIYWCFIARNIAGSANSAIAPPQTKL